MRLITTNEQLLALLPNIMTVVKGERPVIDKIVPFIDAAEKCRSSECRTLNTFECYAESRQHCVKRNGSSKTLCPRRSSIPSQTARTRQRQD